MPNKMEPTHPVPGSSTFGILRGSPRTLTVICASTAPPKTALTFPLPPGGTQRRTSRALNSRSETHH